MKSILYNLVDHIMKEVIMLHKSKFAACLTLILVTFFFTFPTSSFAKWVDKSDELDTGPSLGESVLIGVGIAAAVVLLIVIVNSANNADKEGENNNKSATPDSTASGLNLQGNFSKASLLAEDELSVTPYLGWQRPSSAMALTDTRDMGRIVVGVSVRF